jgi:hypothetical protein
MKLSLKSFLSLLKYVMAIVIVFAIAVVVITLFMPTSMENFEESGVEGIDTKPITTTPITTTPITTTPITPAKPATPAKTATETEIRNTPNMVKKCSEYDDNETECNKSFHSKKGVNCTYADNKCRMVQENE